MLSTNSFLFLLAVLMASIAFNEAQRQRWGQGGWGQMDPFDSSIMFDDDDSPVDTDSSSAGWFSAGRNDVNNRPFRPPQNSPMTGTNRLSSTPTPAARTTSGTTGRTAVTTGRTAATTGRTAATTGRTAATTGRTAGTTRTTGTTRTASPDTTSQTPQPNPQVTQCVSRCPTSPEYNPVCGTNRMTYNNPGRLRCAASCGTDVQLAHYGVCREIGQPQAFPRRDP